MSGLLDLSPVAVIAITLSPQHFSVCVSPQALKGSRRAMTTLQLTVEEMRSLV